LTFAPYLIANNPTASDQGLTGFTGYDTRSQNTY